MDHYTIHYTPGLGLSLICNECDGEDRDVLGFEAYYITMSVRDINQIIAEHAEKFHKDEEQSIWPAL